jgi:DNA polymerase-3 subunit delta'
MSTTVDAAGAPWGLLGQDEAVRALARAVAAGAPAHAYLFAGPEGSGKRALAIRFAQTLNCTAPATGGDPPLVPCGSCRACRHIVAGTYADVCVVTVGGPCNVPEHDHQRDNSRDIKICQVRALEQRLSRAAFEGRWRVEIVDPADALNAQSADAFLKTLEEPPPNAVLILITAREERLPETVRSRLRRIELRRAPLPAIEALLRERGVREEQAAAVARLSGGCTGWALAAATDPAVLEERAAALDEASRLYVSGLAERFAVAAALAGRWAKDRAAVLRTLDIWMSWWRDVLLSAAGAERGMVNVDRLDPIRAAAIEMQTADAARALRALRDARGQLEENANPRLALEVLMLRLPERRESGR